MPKDNSVITTRRQQTHNVLVPEIPWLSDYVELVNSELRGLFPSGRATDLENAVADSLSAGGKRVRATLALLWCEVYSGDCRPAVPLAVAYELAHASALVQDDIIDHSSMRRGEKSIEAKYGLTTALLASDLLLFNVPKMIAKYENLEGARLARIFDLVGEACRATTWGEFLDMEMAKVEEGKEGEYAEMIRLKTSTLLSAPCASGALVGGASYEEETLASRFGEELGMAYQIMDDTLDLVGDEATLGKPVFTDIRGGKKSVVLIHCMSRCSDDDRMFIRALLGRSGPYGKDEISKLLGLIQEHGSLDYASNLAHQHTQAAREVLAATPKGTAKSHLLELADYLASRYY
jgi:geranylgeranyl diphosphate synthase type I